jgi:hypothetical protein
MGAYLSGCKLISNVLWLKGQSSPAAQLPYCREGMGKQQRHSRLLQPNRWAWQVAGVWILPWSEPEPDRRACQLYLWFLSARPVLAVTACAAPKLAPAWQQLQQQMRCLGTHQLQVHTEGWLMQTGVPPLCCHLPRVPVWAMLPIVMVQPGAQLDL